MDIRSLFLKVLLLLSLVQNSNAARAINCADLSTNLSNTQYRLSGKEKGLIDLEAIFKDLFEGKTFELVRNIQNLGRLSVDANLRATISAVTSFRNFHFFVTAEPNSAAATPTSTEIISANILER